MSNCFKGWKEATRQGRKGGGEGRATHENKKTADKIYEGGRGGGGWMSTCSKGMKGVTKGVTKGGKKAASSRQGDERGSDAQKDRNEMRGHII